MKATITVKNYRAFDDTCPARWEIDDDFVALVGINNSGKSSLLRMFYELRPSFELLARANNGNFQNALKTENGGSVFQGLNDQQEVFCNRNDRDMSVEIEVDKSSMLMHGVSDSAVKPEKMVLIWYRNKPHHLSIRIGIGTSLHAVNRFGPSNVPFIQIDNEEVEIDIGDYIKLASEITHSAYIGPFRNAINVGGTSSYYDLQIGQQFIQQWDIYKRGNTRAENKRAIAIEHELQQIFGFSNLEINAGVNQNTLQIIVDDEPYNLHEQGAGLAQFILVLAFVAMKKPTWLFIDEPEQNLHPALQLDFLTTLAKYCTNGVVFATHTIGLARSVAKAVYTLRRREDQSRELKLIEGTSNLVEFLGELSFSGYQALGFRTVLLVEGISDVPTIQRWLRLYGIEHKVVLLPLGGASMINGRSETILTEVLRITDNVAVLIDSERTSPGTPLAQDRSDFVEICEQLGFYTHVLEHRAIENYLTDVAIKRVKGEKYSALSECQLLKDSEPAWAKKENWRIAAEMSISDLEGTDLGIFFQQLVIKVEDLLS